MLPNCGVPLAYAEHNISGTIPLLRAHAPSLATASPSIGEGRWIQNKSSTVTEGGGDDGEDPSTESTTFGKTEKLHEYDSAWGKFIFPIHALSAMAPTHIATSVRAWVPCLSRFYVSRKNRTPSACEASIAGVSFVSLSSGCVIAIVRLYAEMLRASATAAFSAVERYPLTLLKAKEIDDTHR